MEKGLSLIMPVYNASSFIRRTLEYVVRQTYSNYELLVVDDGSTDETLQILKEFEKRYENVRVICQKNQGCGIARNHAIDCATKEYVTFMDHDDYIGDNYLEILMQNVEHYDLLVSGSYAIMRSDFETKGVSAYFKKNIQAEIRVDNISDMATQFEKIDFPPSNLSVVWGKVFRRQIIVENKIKFLPNPAEDHIFSYTYLYYVSSVRQINWAGYYHVQTSDSLGNTHQYIADLDTIHVMEQLQRRLIEKFSIHSEGYLSNLRWRAMNRFTSLAYKGYHQDTRLGRKERMAVWNSIRNDKLFLSIKKMDMLGFRRFILTWYICRMRIYYLLDYVIKATVP